MNSRGLPFLALLLPGAALALVFAPPLAALFPSLRGIAAFSYFAFHLVCHQLPERSFILAGALLPVCARCTGLYAGFFTGWLGWMLLPEPARERPLSNLALAAGLSPLIIDGFVNAAGLFTTPALLRALTGFVFAAAAARALGPALLAAWKAARMNAESPDPLVLGTRPEEISARMEAMTRKAGGQSRPKLRPAARGNGFQDSPVSAGRGERMET